ncbi:hypothetical protein CAI21_15350 [Alkalilimnicola ehrlichii]|uniref:DUF2169 domain-containing protein n=1 Tax=Alkalilimnicola ehrlichii TaxID=351052 RepID=A0A3E0WR06_9GAMM|nr:DUF2169 domain-containing protein [Alkalilimnicola ehrlichii]RFA27221.1 hypothetical protein CAI21_15350 [Alkalilimnicola ehrlichii]RFA35394.1 hypothetical protein CAL65_13015 [Alkalilimnicola ehrlichii]
MLELVNRSDWQAGLFPGWNIQARRQFTLVVKAGFQFDEAGTVEPLEESAAIEPSERYFDKPAESSLAAAPDVAPFKLGSEVLLTGTAYPAKQGARAAETELAIDFGRGEPWKKRLLVIGAWHWARQFISAAPSDPEPLTAVPLRYEYAYGGVDEGHGIAFAANPVGLGYSKFDRRRIGRPLPQIGQGREFARNPSKRKSPAGYGPLPYDWSPRRELRPATDEAAADAGACPMIPPLPAAMHNAAPVDQRFDEPFCGGENVRLSGFFAEQRSVQLVLPSLRPHAWLRVGEASEVLNLVCDTLVIDTDLRQFHLVYRAAIPWRWQPPKAVGSC